MEIGGAGYAVVFVVTLVLTLVLTPLALRIAVRRRILDHPSAIKAQESPVPYLGGLAIVVSFSVVVLAAAVLRPPASGLDQLALILGIGVALAVMGLIDDLKGLSPWLRMGAEVAAGVAIWATPASAEIFANDAANLAVTVVWIVGVTNAMNFLDNMDGLSAGVSAIAAAFLFVLAAWNGQFLVAVFAAALAGCACGFLRSNFHPARIYMGDAGALFLGFLLAVLGLKLEFLDSPRLVGLSVPILVLGIPLFDTTLVTVNRIRHGRSPFQGGRDHASHRLVMVGIPVRVAVLLVYFAAVSVGCLALVQARAESTEGMILLGWVASVGLFAGVLLSLVPVYETSRRRLVMLRSVARHEHEPIAEPGRSAPIDEGGLLA
jgi:UDP-GlcNAc:undecaprenyl-phosphate GlcNAc-1-phosphate transferase